MNMSLLSHSIDDHQPGSQTECVLHPVSENTSTLRGQSCQKSRGAFVEMPYFLNKYDPDALRFYLTATAPETRDSEPVLRAPKDLWEDFVERSNHVLSAAEGNELVATHSLRSVHAWGNLGQRPWVHGLAVVRVQALRWGGAGAG